MSCVWPRGISFKGTLLTWASSLSLEPHPKQPPASPVSGADLSANADEHVDGAKIKTSAPSGSNRRGFSTWSCCLVFFPQDFQDENMFIHFLPLICLPSALWQSLWIQQFRSHTDLDKKSCPLLHTNVPVVALRCEYIRDFLNFLGLCRICEIAT